jgi:hypothetical protein
MPGIVELGAHHGTQKSDPELPSDVTHSRYGPVPYLAARHDRLRQQGLARLLATAARSEKASPRTNKRRLPFRVNDCVYARCQRHRR